MAVAASALAAAALPEIREGSVTMTQADDRTVTISYTLDGAPAIVTVDIHTNGVPLTGALLKGRLTGDFNRKVAPGVHAVTWNPSLDQRIAGDRRWTDCATTAFRCKSRAPPENANGRQPCSRRPPVSFALAAPYFFTSLRTALCEQKVRSL